MAFLDNSGDIILDAVLTELGRRKLAQGNGTFNITKFSVADDEIDYRLFNISDPSGSAYYDLNVNLTPVLEPNTNSSSGLQFKLKTYANPNILYLPVLKLNQNQFIDSVTKSSLNTTFNAFVVLVNDTAISSVGTGITTISGLIDGRRNIATGTGAAAGGTRAVARNIRVSQGFDSLASDVQKELADLEDTSFDIYANRLFLDVIDSTGVFSSSPKVSSTAFSRNQAYNLYSVDTTNNPNFFNTVNVYNNGSTVSAPATSLNATYISQVGKDLSFSLRISDFLASNPSYYFNTYGSIQGTTISGLNSSTALHIFTSIRVVGANIGHSIDVPVVLIYQP
jgi:hypothetical protein